MEHLLYGAAYYAEYLPEERLERDMELMTQAGFNLIRVAESTWSTWEPEDGVFDFSVLEKVLRAAQAHSVAVIVGTPTYAIPPWLAQKHPDILAETHDGRRRYGARQNFDITHPGYRFHARRIIRKLMETVQPYSCVIGFQLDNETKHYDTCCPRVQARFRDYLKARFGTVDALNQEMGFAYWSNSVRSWDELPDVRGTINGSYGAEFQAFQRGLVTGFLLWQREIVDEYRRPEQFITHNFDYEWRGISFGLQPDADQFDAAEAVDIAGCDIYHESAGRLTGAEIAFGGALARGLKQGNYLVLETQAQGNFGWFPYPGQLKLQAFAHLAGGADGVEYWHWHSIHNAVESYWKGVLSHDGEPGETYREAAETGWLLRALSPQLLHLKKENRVAVMVSNRSLTGMQWFPACRQDLQPERNYNDYLRWLCDSLYRLNIEYDIVPDRPADFSRYSLVILPCLYAASEPLLQSVREYVRQGGSVIATFKTAFADEHLKIRHDTQPHSLDDCFGIRYDRFTKPEEVRLEAASFPFPGGTRVLDWMELLEPCGADTLCTYRHPVWGGIPAVTENTFGQGKAVYLGCYFEQKGLDALLRYLLPRLGIPVPEESFPVIVKSGVNPDGQTIRFYLNFSPETHTVSGAHPAARELLTGSELGENEPFRLEPWGVRLLASCP